MTGFRTPSNEWLGEEVEKQKERDAAERGEAVVVISDDPEGVRIVQHISPVEVELPVTAISPEDHRKVGIAQIRAAFDESLVRAEKGRDWMKAIGYRDEPRKRAEAAVGVLLHLIELIEAEEGVR